MENPPLTSSIGYSNSSTSEPQLGCEHYKRKCKIRSPCCGEIFSCRHCHNEAKNINENDMNLRHEISRKDIKYVICRLCDCEQEVKQYCSNCGVCMGKYFCSICNFFDDDTSKGQYHCHDCGICRVGGRENYFHCNKCGCCYSNALKEEHVCIENNLHQDCPVCFEYLFDSIKISKILKCGHSLHSDCFQQMIKHSKYFCPFCSKSMVDMSPRWRRYDQIVANTPVPPERANVSVAIWCNDCLAVGDTKYHFIALKCNSCGSYNTRKI